MRIAMLRNALLLASVVVCVLVVKVAVTAVPAIVFAVHNAHAPTLASSAVR